MLLQRLAAMRPGGGRARSTSASPWPIPLSLNLLHPSQIWVDSYICSQTVLGVQQTTG